MPAPIDRFLQTRDSAAGARLPLVRLLPGTALRHANVRDPQDQIFLTDPEILESISTSVFVGLADDLDLQQRGNLIDLDKRLHAHWALGNNCILGWSPYESGLLLLVVHHYAIADYAIADRFHAAGIELTKVQWLLLKRLERSDGLPQHNLAFLTNRNTASLTRLITTMEKKNLVARIPSRDDHRIN